MVVANLDARGVGESRRRWRGSVGRQWSGSDGRDRPHRFSCRHGRHRSHRQTVGTTPPTCVGEWQMSFLPARLKPTPSLCIRAAVAAGMAQLRVPGLRWRRHERRKAKPSPLPRHPTFRSATRTQGRSSARRVHQRARIKIPSCALRRINAFRFGQGPTPGSSCCLLIFERVVW